MIKLQDQRQRERITADLESNFLVEAGAGSGKTTSLVSRFVALVKSGKYGPGQVAAITFTRRAAAELKGRVQIKLEKELKQTEDFRIKKRLAGALENLNNYYMGTIHSFCARLLQQRPVEFGVDPDFSQLDEVAEEEKKKHVWENYLIKSSIEREELIEKLEKTGISLLDLQHAFNKLCYYPEVELVYEKLEKPNLTDAVKKVTDFVENALQYMPHTEPEKGYDSLQKKINFAYAYLKYSDISKDINKYRVLKCFEGSLSVTLNRWQNKDVAREYRDKRAPSFVESVIEPILKKYREYRHYLAVEFLEPALEFYKEKRLERGELTFQDLLILTARGLRNKSSLRKYFKNRYKSILVDEFQDTDPLQAEILFYLSGDNLEEKNWQNLHPEPGSLFLVGDPKQSIYRFRRADIDIYNTVKKQLKNGRGEVLTLTSNFRSLPAVTTVLNPVFKTLLPEKGNAYQAPYARLNAVRPEAKKSLSGVKKINITSKSKNKKDVAAADAKKIAELIYKTVQEGLELKFTGDSVDETKKRRAEYGDFMILLRYKDNMGEYVKALKERGIATDVTGGSTFDRSVLEIRELHKLLSFIDDYHNSVLLAAVLRGLFFGLADEDLYHFRKAGGKLDINSDLPENLDDDIKGRFKESFQKLKTYKKWSRDFNPSNVLEMILEDTGLISYITEKVMGENICSNIFFLLEMIKSKEAEQGIKFSDMVNEFSRLLDRGVEEELNLYHKPNAVRVMNLHRAKGLQAPVVFLAHPKKNTSHTPGHHITRTGNLPRGYFKLKKNIGSYWSETLTLPPDWEKYKKEEEKYSEAEEIRLLYVAATRAENMLVISSYGKNRKNAWKPLLVKLEDIEEFKIEDVKDKNDKKVNEEKLSSEKFIKKLNDFEPWPESLNQNTYGIYSAVETVDSVDVQRIDVGESPQARGRVAHSMARGVVEYRLNKDQLNDFVKEIALSEKLSESDIEEVKKMGERLINSNLCNRINKSAKVLTEVPFTYMVNLDDKQYKEIKEITGFSREKKLPIYLTGRIDLVFEENNEWVVVDYKTSRVKDKDDRKKLKESYKNQLKIYSLVWQAMTNDKVKDNIIWWL
ncbi:MAG: UvrD-helicase domain-containing protein [Bacillota bacterium]